MAVAAVLRPVVDAAVGPDLPVRVDSWDGSSIGPLRLDDVGYDHDGRLRYPHHDDRAAESVLREYLSHAERLLAERADAEDDDRGGLRPDFEALRWFELPSVSVRAR